MGQPYRSVLQAFLQLSKNCRPLHTTLQHPYQLNLASLLPQRSPHAWLCCSWVLMWAMLHRPLIMALAKFLVGHQTINSDDAECLTRCMCVRGDLSDIHCGRAACWLLIAWGLVYIQVWATQNWYLLRLCAFCTI